MIIIKTLNEIEKIVFACEIWKKVKSFLTKNFKKGISLNTLDEMAKTVMLENNCLPAFKNYLDFPKNICISRNEIIIHGIPDNSIIQEGDKVTFDVGVNYKNYYCDAAFTLLLEPISNEWKKITKITYDSLMNGIKAIKEGSCIGAIGSAVSQTIFNGSNNYYLLPNFSGHGCGKQIHESPYIYNIASENNGCKIRPGMTLCIEPMVMTDSEEYICDTPQWNVRPINKKSLVSHWEHMILINSDYSVTILTDTNN